MKTYLSIDLDYWRNHTSPEACTRFFKAVWKTGLPVYTSFYHHHLLGHVNESGCRRLINVDYHSDLSDLVSGHVLTFEEGTWVNFVDWRHKGEFIWRFPSTQICVNEEDGYCHAHTNPFQHNVSGWGTATKRVGVYGIPWRDITAIGVCLSPDWISKPSIIAEPLSRLRIEPWVKRYDQAVAHNETPYSQRPKLVRIK